MRSFRVTSLAAALLALAVVSACKESTTGLGAVTCAAADAFLCPPSTLDLGYTGPTGAPTIVPGSGGSSVTVGTSAYVVTGTTSSTTQGYWLLVSDGALSSWGVLTLGTGGVYGAEVPLFCGAQTLIYRFTNAAGTAYYVLEVNRTGCAGPSAFRVQLTWTSDAYSDLDLHLLRPGGSYGTSNDCYFGNCTGTGLTWGSGHPILDVDDTDGFGPENIYLTSGTEAGEYRIIVHNWDGTLGEVATVKIYFNDVEAARFTSSALNATTARYWEVAKVIVASRSVVNVNAYSSTAPVSLGAAPPWVPTTK